MVFAVLWCSEWFSVCCQGVVSGFECGVRVFRVVFGVVL